MGPSRLRLPQNILAARVFANTPFPQPYARHLSLTQTTRSLPRHRESLNPQVRGHQRTHGDSAAPKECHPVLSAIAIAISTDPRTPISIELVAAIYKERRPRRRPPPLAERHRSRPAVYQLGLARLDIGYARKPCCRIPTLPGPSEHLSPVAEAYPVARLVACQAHHGECRV
jgi:hypothetical protein